MGNQLEERLNMRNRYTLSEIKDAVAPIAEAYGVNRVYLFGSHARDSANEKSDIDIKIEKGKIKSLLELSSFRLDLEDALGVSVDLLTSTMSNKELLNRIARDEVLIYEKQG